MRVDEGIDALTELAAVNNCPPNLRILLENGIEGAAISLERKLAFLEWADQRAELQFLVDIGLHVLFVQRCTLEIPPGILGSGSLGERHVAAVAEHIEDLGRVKIPLQGPLPFVNRKGGVGQRFPEAVHVRDEACLIQTSRNPINMISFDSRTRAAWELVALAGGEWLTGVVRVGKMLPQGFFREDVINSLGSKEYVVVKIIRIVIKTPVFVVVRRNKTEERHKFLRMNVKPRRGDGLFALSFFR